MGREWSSGKSTEKATEGEDTCDKAKLAITHGYTFGKTPCSGGKDDGGRRGTSDAANDGFGSVELSLHVRGADQSHIL